MSDHDDFSTTTALPDDSTLTADSGTDQPWSFDTDNNGVTDVIQWDFSDGTWQELVDVDGDGNADVLLIDIDGDDSADLQIWDNGDGTYTAAQDADGDGEFETQESFTRAELDSALPGVADLLDTKFGPASDTPPTDTPPTDAPPTDSTGTPPTTDTDGVPTEFDTDQDGVTDLIQWDFADGTWQALVDIDSDANPDALIIDTNGDGAADIQIWDNGDGTYTAVQDADGDGTFEAEQTFTRAELDTNLPGVGDLLDSQFGQSSTPTDPGTTPTDGPTDPGTPAADDAPVLVDSDGDGVGDTLVWDFGDGTWQQLSDVDGDGNADLLVIDTNGDDTADYAISDNGDGSYSVFQPDANGDWTESQSFTRDELDAQLPGIGELLDTEITDNSHNPIPDQGTDTPVDQPVDQPVDTGSPVPLDTDNDGTDDTVQWNFGDGTWQELRDLDGDGNADVLVIDTNGDDLGDYAIVDNGDGSYTLYQDADGDGQWDDEGQTFSRDELDASLPGVGDLLDSKINGTVAGDGDQPTNEPVVNDPTTPVTPDDTTTTPDTVIPGSSGNPVTDAGWVAYDTDGDGTVDAEAWSFADGTWQALIDVDGNGQPDVLAIDTNGDDVEDIQVWDNGDGTFTVLYDADGDGTFEVQNTFDQAELDARLPGAADLLHTQYAGALPTEPTTAPTDPTTDPTTDPSDVGYDPTDAGYDPTVDGDQMAGDPVADSQYWFNQAENGFCVPSSVAMIVSAYTGEEILSEEQFVALANDLGLFNVDMEGTPSMTMDGALTLLEAAGIPAEMVVGDMNSLYDAVDEGRGVMLFIDSDEVWFDNGEGDHAPDHAVVITGIDREAGVAYLSDPGSPDGNMEVVPLSILEDAWEDSGYTMVVCDEPAPDFSGDAATTAHGAQPQVSGLQATTASLVSSPWALLPVVLPADAVTPVTAETTTA